MHRAYKDTTLEEIKSFIGIMILMGLKKDPQFQIIEGMIKFTRLYH